MKSFRKVPYLIMGDKIAHSNSVYLVAEPPRKLSNKQTTFRAIRVDSLDGPFLRREVVTLTFKNDYDEVEVVSDAVG